MINGAKQGRKQFDPRGASAISRRGIWQLASKIVVMLAATGGVPVIDKLSSAFNAETYNALKKDALLRDRRKVKHEVVDEALRGWTRNAEDDFSLKIDNSP